MRNADFLPNFITGIVLIFLAISIQLYYPENIGSVIAFGIIGVAYLVIAYYQFNNKS